MTRRAHSLASAIDETEAQDPTVRAARVRFDREIKRLRLNVATENRYPTATEALAAAGFIHRPSETGLMGAHDIINASGAVVATLRAGDVWEWLRALPSEGKADV